MKEPLAKDQEKFVLRLPDGMRDRIKLAAERNNRSMNAEIIAALEEKYPPHSIDVGMLMLFLDSLGGASGDIGKEYIAYINDEFAKTGRPYTVESEDGVVKFFPYASPKKTLDK